MAKQTKKTTNTKTSKKKVTRRKKTVTNQKSLVANQSAIQKRKGRYIARPVCFTTSYKRPYHIFNCINNILNNQSYKDIKYIVGICIDNDIEKKQYETLLQDFAKDNRLQIFYHQNMDQHENYIYPIKKIDYHKYNLFIKIDDDDIYKHSYLENIIDNFSKHQIDIISAKIKYQIESNHISEGEFDTVSGAWGPDLQSNIKFGMPCTYAFNNKALDIILKLTPEENHKIHPFEDPVWRTRWREKNLLSYVIPKFDHVLYHKHQNNVSSPNIRKSKPTLYNNIENDFCSICLFEHQYWKSYVILNKRNNRMYNIDNNDHGSFEYIDDDSIKIIWDEWGEETFYKKYDDKNYYYSVK